jgi:hypothetical protein
MRRMVRELPGFRGRRAQTCKETPPNDIFQNRAAFQATIRLLNVRRYAKVSRVYLRVSSFACKVFRYAS